MSDYRNRPSVDSPRRIEFGRTMCFGFVGGFVVSAAAWYGIAIAAGLAW